MCTVNVATYGMPYVEYLQHQLREGYVYDYVVYNTERHRTCDMYSSSCSSVNNGAAHELSTLLYYVRYVPRTVLTAPPAAVWSFYAATLWDIACVRFSFPHINALCNVRSVRYCANAARTRHAFPFSPSPLSRKSSMMLTLFFFPYSRKFPPTSVRVRVPDLSLFCLYALCLGTKTFQRKLLAFSSQDFAA